MQSYERCGIYILTNVGRTVLYTGVANDIRRRVHEHREGLGGLTFTTRYRTRVLVYYEHIPEIVTAIAREKQIKGWTRRKKIALIERLNPGWRDLWPDLSA